MKANACKIFYRNVFAFAINSECYSIVHLVIYKMYKQIAIDYAQSLALFLIAYK